MRTYCTFVVLVSVAGVASHAAPASPSPAEIAIAKSAALVAKQPGHVPYYAALAMAYARRARETSDVAYYAQAEATVDRGLKVSPDDYELLKVRTWLQLGRHEFAAALESARKLNKRSPDDVTVYGYLADANAELGNYKEAIDAVQWMLNLRPGNLAALTRASYLRELHGDTAGARELMTMANESTPLSEFEDRAWIETQIGHLYFLEANLPQAEKHAKQALELFPDYHYALGLLASVRLAQGMPGDAAALLEKRYRAAPHAENQFAYAEALLAAGLKEEAQEQFAQFEKKSFAETGNADNSNHELIFYYTDVAHQPSKALEVARREMARRHDIFTLDAYAWALASGGSLDEAKTQIKKALATGAKDPKLVKHAAALRE